MFSSLLFGFLMLGVTEVFIKPLASWVVKEQTKKWLPKLLDSLDPVMPSLIKNRTESEIRSLILQKYFEITGEKPKNADAILKTFSDAYSPLKNAEKLNG